MSTDNEKINKNYSFKDFAAITGGVIEKVKNDQGFQSEDNQPVFESFCENAFSCFFMTDYQRMIYIYISSGIKNILGYDSEFYLRQGIEFFFESIHPQDKIKLKVIHEKMFEIFYNTPIEERINLKFDFNLRVKTYSGEYVHLLHQTTFVKLSDQGDPVLDYSTCTDISKYKNDNFVKLTIYKLSGNAFQQVFELEITEKNISLTKRQSEIMELISQGFTSKEIAEKLFISYDTVKNHRRNIISNNQTKNMAETLKVVFGGKR